MVIETGYSRETWLKMDGTKLDARCLDYLVEVERQRLLCGKLSGRVDGMIKSCVIVASEITRAIVEKVETTGDVMYLKNQELTEELKESKRREEGQDKEIYELRNAVANLEKEVRALKEGWGPYPAINPAPPPSTKKTTFTKAAAKTSNKTLNLNTATV